RPSHGRVRGRLRRCRARARPRVRARPRAVHARTQPVTRPLPPGLVDRDALAFAGRDRELEALSTTWKEVGILSARRVVALGGDAGIGKTRLLSELAAEVQLTGAGVLLGRSDHDAFVPHQPVAEIMGQLATWAPTDTAVAETIERHREPLS